MIIENSLLARNPEAGQMYDNEKNKEIDLPPSNIIPYNSSKLAHFQCLEHPKHRFMEYVNKMTRPDGTSIGCKICNSLARKAALFKDVCPIGVEWWDKTRNTLLLDEISCYDRNYAFFICEQGHHFKKRISSFFQTPKCDDCENEKKSIATVKPRLLPFFDKNANNSDATQIRAHSSGGVFWKCPSCGYTWNKAPKAIRNTQDRCPKCKFRPTLHSGVSFEEFNPNASKLWIKQMNGKNTPQNILYNERTVIYIRCPNNENHIISKQVFRIPRTFPYGCKLCTNTVVKPEESFGSLCYHLLEEFDREKNHFSPFAVSEVSTKDASWICKNNPEHKWSAKIIERARGRGNCPYCNNKKSKFSELHANLKPYFDEKANGISFDGVTENNNPEYYFRCDIGHFFKTKITNLSQKNKFVCPVCNGSIVIQGETDLKSQYPNIASEYSTTNPQKTNEISIYNTNPDTAWECKIGHKYRCSVYNRVFFKANCRQCNKKINKSIIETRHKTISTSIVEKYPQIDEIYDYEKNSKELNTINVADNRNYNFKCELGHSYSATLSSVINERFKCQVCTGKKLQKGVNSMADLYPNLIKSKWDWLNNYLLGDPRNILPNCSDEFWFKCPICSNSFLMPLNKYIKKYGSKDDDYDYKDNNGCLYCKGLRRKRTYII